jgi:membrane associated rhomboid family serine protease
VADTQYCYRHPDRETGLSCSECGRPICVDCMTVAPVGIRCPDHAATGRALGQTVKAARPSLSRDSTLVTKALIAFNLAFYLITVAQGVGVNQPGGRLFGEFALYGPLVADGDWWRLITAAFLHASLLHIAFNMLALWWIGGPLEQAIGPWRFLAIYGVSGLAGSAGALLASPQAVTVGASGAIFGLFGAMVVIQWQTTGSLAGPAMTLILVNLAITFAVPNISWGGHVGGLVGGVLATLALTHFGTRHVAYARITPLAVVSLIAIGVGSVLVAYWRVRGLA